MSYLYDAIKTTERAIESAPSDRMRQMWQRNHHELTGMMSCEVRENRPSRPKVEDTTYLERKQSNRIWDGIALMGFCALIVAMWPLIEGVMERCASETHRVAAEVQRGGL